MTERVVRIGRDRTLIGVVSEPPEGLCEHAVLLLNAGLIHRIGPNRLYVDFARRFAHHGALACRFDFAGIGDSPATTTPRASFRIEAALQVSEVMDTLANDYGVRTFSVLGICSGGEVAAEAAARDARITAAVIVNSALVDDVTYYRRLSEFRRTNARRLYLRKILSVGSWKRLIGGKSHLWSRLSAAARRRLRPSARGLRPETSTGDEVFGASQIGNEVQSVNWAAILAHKCRLSIIHAESSVNLDAFRAAGCAPRSPLIAERVLPMIDHGFTALSSHEQLFDAALRHLMPEFNARSIAPVDSPTRGEQRRSVVSALAGTFSGEIE